MPDKALPYVTQVEMAFMTNVFGVISSCKCLFPILRDGSRYDNTTHLLTVVRYSNLPLNRWSFHLKGCLNEQWNGSYLPPQTKEVRLREV